MSKNKMQLDKFEQLRQQAEKLVKERPGPDPPTTDIFELIHELSIHQAELEIQNEELQRAQQELSELQHEFEDLYEFAPCGYLTLNPNGIITRINLSAADLLNGVKKRIVRTGLGMYIAPGGEEFYFNARKKAGENGEKQSVDLPLKSDNGTPLWVRAEIQADRNSTAEVIQWRIVLVDVTERKQAEELSRKLNEILEQRVAERTAELKTRARQLQQLARQLSETEDRERKQLATILHDDFQQDIAYVKIELDSLLQITTDKKITQKLVFLKNIVSENIGKMRSLAYDIYPTAMLQQNLFQALEMLAQEMKDKYCLNLKVQTQPDAENEALILVSILYRIIRELLINVVKHAGVNSAILSISSKNEITYIQVEDFGKGFDYDTVKACQDKGKGFGLYNIEDRIRFLGGSMKIKTASDKGCCITLTVPNDFLHQKETI